MISGWFMQQQHFPPGLTDLLCVLLQMIETESNRTDPILLPDDVWMDDAVPLTALILDYLVAYIPTSDPGKIAPIFLCGVPVRTYECVVTFDAHPIPSGSSAKRERTSVMKFSCPQSLEEEEAMISPQVVVDGLSSLFEGRLTQIGDESAKFEIVCGGVTFDRLAL